MTSHHLLVRYAAVILQGQNYWKGVRIEVQEHLDRLYNVTELNFGCHCVTMHGDDVQQYERKMNETHLYILGEREPNIWTMLSTMSSSLNSSCRNQCRFVIVTLHIQQT